MGTGFREFAREKQRQQLLEQSAERGWRWPAPSLFGNYHTPAMLWSRWARPFR
jgi:hypothetical protein